MTHNKAPDRCPEAGTWFWTAEQPDRVRIHVKNSRSAASLGELLFDDPKMAAALIVAIVAGCGFLAQVFFYVPLNINYLAFIGADDLATLALNQVPIILLILSSLVLSLMVLAGLTGGLLALDYWWSSTGIRLVRARLRRVERHLKARGSSASWTLLIEAAVRLERVFRRRTIRPRERRAPWQHVREDFAMWCAWPKEHWSFCLLALVALAGVASVVMASAASAQFKWEQTSSEVSSQRAVKERSLLDWLIDFTVPVVLQRVTVNVDHLDAPLQDAVLLGRTSDYYFLWRESGALALPAAEAEVIAFAHEMPGDVRKPAPASDDELVAAIEGIAQPVDAVQEDVRQLLERPTVMLELPAVQPVDGLSADCRENRIAGVDFRFARGEFDFAADAVPEELNDVNIPVSVQYYNRVQLARLADYIVTNPFGYEPGDFLQVVGYASSDGAALYNLQLSEDRARAAALEIKRMNIWNRMDAFPGWLDPQQLRASIEEMPGGEGIERARFQTLEPRNRAVLVYHCRGRRSEPEIKPRADGPQMAAAE